MEFVRYFDFLTILLFGLIWLGICVFLRFKKKKSFVYLLFFTLFFIYLYKVLDYTLFQFQSLLLLKLFMPNLILNGQTAEKSINLIPLLTLTTKDIVTSLLNILLMIPFGLGLPFITNLRMKNVVIMGGLFSIVIELVQLVTGYFGGTTFRIADVNDVLFNTAGVTIGYLLFVRCIHICRYISTNVKLDTNPIIRYITLRSQV